MRVVHLVRAFLDPSETFIYSQLTHLAPDRAVVLARDSQNQERFPRIVPHTFSAGPRTRSKNWADANYRVLRNMVAPERRFYESEVRALKPDLFHAHFAVDAAYFQSVWRDFGRPVVVSCYGYDVASFPNRYWGLGSRYLRPVWKHATLILAMSRDMRQDLLSLGCPESKIKIHYHGIDLTRFVYVQRDFGRWPVRILFVGALSERKGVDDLLRAFTQIATRYDRVDLRFVGSGRSRRTLEQQARARGLESRVSFAGFVDHDRLQAELERADVFCHPSRTLKNGDKEGIPNALVEAMATGLPVVTTRHAGIPEMVRDGRDGFVVAEGDIGAIARALLALIDTPSLRSQMGLSAAMRAQETADVVRLTRELDSIYAELVDASGRSGLGAHDDL